MSSTASRPESAVTRRLSLATCYLLLVIVVGCRVSLSPIKNRVAVGEESYVVMDGDGEGGEGDLFVGLASGGSVFRITYTRVHESSPAISPNGIMLAFIRGAHGEDSAGHRIWIMNLLNGGEREVPELGEGAYPRNLGWSLDGSTLYAATSRGIFQIPAPPSTPRPTAVAPASRPEADTALGVPLGLPVMAVAGACDSGICAFNASGSQLVTPTGRAPFRWGPDSVAYFVGESVRVRPLGGGTTREVRWTGLPSNLRGASQFPGVDPPPP